MNEDTKYALDILNANNAIQIKRLWVTVFILIFLLVGSNIAWLIYENSFEDISTEVTQEIQSLSGDTTIEHNYPGAVINGED
jgi:abortive infection bacteriophage resistance protein